jgi:deoxyribonuclease-1
VSIEFILESEEKSQEKPANQANQSKSTNVSKPSGKFSCDDKKTCGQMTSCEEAKYHLTICGDKKLDLDNNGVPCESICK